MGWEDGNTAGSRAWSFAPSERKLGPPRELRANHRKATGPRMKKGAGASPPFLRTDPPKPESQSRLGIRPPREANLFEQRCFWKRANHVPAFAWKFTIEQAPESTGVSSLGGYEGTTTGGVAYRFPQRNGGVNPFFGRQQRLYMPVTWLLLLIL